MADQIDHEALFIRACEERVVAKGMRWAHQRGRGLLVRRIHKPQAVDAITRAAAAYAKASIAAAQSRDPMTSEMRAMAAAQESPLEDWWVWYPTNAAAGNVREGDLFFTATEVQAATEEFDRWS